MRIATLIIGLVLMLGVFIQSLLAAAGGSLAADKELQNAASWGLIVAFGFLLGSALVIAKPRFAMWTFAASAAIAILAGATSAFRDLIVWGVVAAVLSLMAWRGSVEKRRKDAADEAQRAQFAMLVEQRPA
jgi:hypothetical protein